MGAFNNFLQFMDSGVLEKKLNSVADKVDDLANKVATSVDNLAQKPEKLAQNMETVQREASKTAKLIKSQ